MVGLQPRRLSVLTIATALLAAATTRSAALLEIQPGTARPGDAILIRIRGVASAPTGKLGARQLTFVAGPGGYWALAPLEIEQAPGEVAVSVTEPSEQSEGEMTGTVTVVEPNFNRRELTVANRFIHPSAAERRWLAEDQAAFERVYDRPLEPPLFTQDFRWPRQSTVTGHFGDLRLLNGAKDSQHYGVDLDGRTGAPVFSANDGEVVLVRRCFATGNTVVIYHGAGLFTAYFHLSQTRAAVGHRVRQGQIIGAVGRTGRVTGPHLHWAAKVDKLYVDPESLLRLKFK